MVADAQNDPVWIAADLLSQAEHDEAAKSILITDDAEFADQVELAVGQMLPKLREKMLLGNHGLIMVLLLPCHPWMTCLYWQTRSRQNISSWRWRMQRLVAENSPCWCHFLGRHTPEAIGDYVAGPNHVLPTARTARFSSGLGVADFMKRTTTVACDADGFAGNCTISGCACGCGRAWCACVVNADPYESVRYNGFRRRTKKAKIG